MAGAWEAQGDQAGAIYDKNHKTNFRTVILDLCPGWDQGQDDFSTLDKS